MGSSNMGSSSLLPTSTTAELLEFLERATPQQIDALFQTDWVFWRLVVRWFDNASPRELENMSPEAWANLNKCEHTVIVGMIAQTREAADEIPVPPCLWGV